MSNELTKDVMLVTKSARKGKDTKGRDTLQLSLTQEEAHKMAEALAGLLENERGVKLNIHYGEKTTETGRSFLSSFFFVKAIQEFGATQGGAPKSFVAKSTSSTKDKISALQAKMAK